MAKIALAHNSHALPIILEALLVRAQMQVVLGDEQASRADVVTAVKLAEPEGFITIFLEEGRPIARILTSLLASNQLKGVRADHARKILAAYPEIVQATVSIKEAAAAKDALIEPLSKREETMNDSSGYTDIGILSHGFVPIIATLDNLYSDKGKILKGMRGTACILDLCAIKHCMGFR